MHRTLIAIWGVAGVALLLAQAVYRLTPRAIEAMVSGLPAWQWAFLVVWVAFMAHSEGYKGFHQRFSPRVIARATVLGERDVPVTTAIFAPFWCMSLFGSTRKGMIVARSITAGVIVLIIIVRMLPQPWRGIIDAGVVVGLGMGLVSMAYFGVLALQGHKPSIDPELPPFDPELDARGERSEPLEP